MKTDQHAAQLAEALRALIDEINGSAGVDRYCALIPDARDALRSWDAHNAPAPTQRALL